MANHHTERNTVTQLRGHGMLAEGAAHNDDGERTQWNTVAGPGRAKCACGWLSEPAESGNERKRMHHFHKEFTRALAAYPSRYVMGYGAVVDEAASRTRSGESKPLNPDSKPTTVIDRGE